MPNVDPFRDVWERIQWILGAAAFITAAALGALSKAVRQVSNERRDGDSELHRRVNEIEKTAVRKGEDLRVAESEIADHERRIGVLESHYQEILRTQGEILGEVRSLRR